MTGYPHHVINRGNDRRQLFFSNDDYDAFLHLMVVGKSRHAVKVYGVAILPNHFHALIVPVVNDALSGYLRFVSGSYAARLRARTDTIGHGHVFQRRFWSDPINEERHFFSVLRYIEANPVVAQLVERSELWRWSSAALRADSHHSLLDVLPVNLPRDWSAMVNLPQPPQEVDNIRRAFRKNRRPRTTPR
jgi:putative transposase